MTSILSIAGLTAAQNESVNGFLTSADISYTMDAVSQLTATVADTTMQMFKGNYFQVRREVNFGTLPFEIASVEIDQGDGGGANVTIEARRSAIQKMKRDKTPGAIGGSSATDYARLAAAKFGLAFVGEPTTTKRSINKATGGDNDESVWSVITRLAGEAQFQAFESDGTLYFASQEWLLGKWANLTFKYPSDESSPFQVLNIPNCRRSDDDVHESTCTFLLRRSSTTESLRAGMTIKLSGMGEFDRDYLISEVSYSLGVPDPIGVSCRTPVKKKPKTS